MSSIGLTFQRIQEANDGALIGYVTGGDPEPRYTPPLVEALIKGGVDIVELGIPFSDPIADGPTIQAASVRALTAGVTPKMVLGMADKIKEKYNVPVAIMTYYNPVFRMGVANFFKQAESCRVDGLIVPDLPIEEASEYVRAAKSCGIDTIFLAAPSTTRQRLCKIMDHSSGFLYLVSHFGVTGEKPNMDKSTRGMVERFRRYTNRRIPLAVGFGVSKPEHARCLIEAGAEGVIVGSAFVNIVQRNRGDIPRMLDEIEETARKLKAAIRAASHSFARNRLKNSTTRTVDP